MEKAKQKVHELEKVNWSLVKHYVLQAENALNAMQSAYSEEARQSLMRTAERFMLAAMQQVEHCLTGRSQIKLWASLAAMGCMPGWSSRLNVLMHLTW